MFRLMLNPTKGRFSTYLLVICFAVFCLEARAEFVITLSAESNSSTTVTVTGSGSVTSNNNQDSFSAGFSTSNQFSNLGDFVKSSGPNNKTYNFPGSLTLAGGGDVISLTSIFIDDDGGNDDFGLSPAGSTGSLSGNTVYTLGGSTTFGLSGNDTYADLNPGTYIPSHVLNGGGWQNFDPNIGVFWFSVVGSEITAIPEPSTGLLSLLGLAGCILSRSRRRSARG